MIPPAPAKAAERAEAARLLDGFLAAGAELIETEILQPADALLDLYGEDIRARAFTTFDPLRGERMLRPDFTVPVVQMHMASGADPARYTYAGEVFRRQEEGSHRPSEYLQVGLEVFDGSDPAAADAEVFWRISDLLAGLRLRVATGDIGVLKAAVLGLDASRRRQAALLRHIWRPRRFRALLERYAGRSPMPSARRCLLAARDPFAAAGPEIGLRTRADVEERIAALRADAEEPVLSAGEVALIDDILSLKAPAPDALAHLRDIAVDLPAISGAVAGLDRRLEALAGRGIDVASLPFEAAHGRGSMEYYDGFVFTFSIPTRPDLPPVATGGRYDALTLVLGEGRAIPAVGGVIRPALSLMAGAAR